MSNTTDALDEAAKGILTALDKFYGLPHIDEKAAIEIIKKHLPYDNLGDLAGIKSSSTPSQAVPEVDAGELEKLFENNSDCYADTGRFENDGSWTEGDTIPAMTKEKFIQTMTKALHSSVGFGIEDIEKAFDAGMRRREDEIDGAYNQHPVGSPDKSEYIKSLK